MKIIFAGTPQFAALALEALINEGHEIMLVLTQPDRPSGRGMKLNSSAVKLLAQKYKLNLLQPSSLKQTNTQAKLEEIGADIMVVAAYGLILPSNILDYPKLGCINIHASLLPHWRGAAPIQRAILAGEKETGITIIQMDQNLDTGNILLQESIPILTNDNSKSLNDRLALLGASCVVKVLNLIENHKITSTPQNEENASYAPKLKKEEARINWQLSAKTINNSIRAFNPRPGAYSTVKGHTLKIFQAKLTFEEKGHPGEILATGKKGIVVACGKGSLILEVVQKPGGKKLSASEFLAGNFIKPGDRFISGK